MGERNKAGQDSKKHPLDKSPPIISAQDLFAGLREIRIEHEGELYRLRITRRNKLILQK